MNLSEEVEKMKMKAPIKKKNGKRWSQKVRTASPKLSSRAICLQRRSLSEFSCGIDDPGVLLIEESLDERERRG
jgi:predicted nucleotide-binding protein (sugar kinase/HSP70/actin superfamily)